MKTDIEIAQSTKLRPITEIADIAGIADDYLEQYGKYKAKINLSLLNEKNKTEVDKYGHEAKEKKISDAVNN